MQDTTADYKLEIIEPSRQFECKITIGKNIYTNSDITNLVLEYTQPQEGFSIGNTLSQSLDLTLLNKEDIIYSTSQIKLEIGLKIGDKIEYILMGIFNIYDIEKTDYTTKFTAYDNMMKFETAYYSELGDNPTLEQVVNELSSKTGVEFTGSLPAYTVSKLEGFTCRNVLSYVASICGGNAIITRDGKFTIKELEEVEKTIDGHTIFLNNYIKEEIKYKVGQVSCQVSEGNILSKGSTGTDSMEVQFENPWVTESILNEIYNKLKSVEYLGYSMKWHGDIALDLYDIVTVTDAKNVTRKLPILSQKFTFYNGITSEIGAKGETKNKNDFSSGGSLTDKINRAIIEQAIIKDAIIEKANIKDVEAVSIRTQNLEAKTAKIEEAIIGVAHIEDLNTINANIEKLIAADATINNALIGKADITELNAVKGTITSLDSKIANIETLVNGNLSSENIQAGGITGANLNMDTIFVKDANMVNVNINSLKAGDFSTTKFRIVSDSGNMLISDNTIQITDKNRVRVQIGKDASNDYNMYVWDSAGKLMFDATGLKADGIKNKIIRDDMISDNANIDGAKLNISSLITEINKDTNTNVIKSTKVQIDSLKQTLEVAFNSLKNQADSTKSLTESHSTTIGVMQGQITTAINNTQIVKDGQTILLKDDYNRTVSLVNSINSTIGTHTTKIDELSGNITSVDTKVNSVQRDLEGTKSTVSSHSTSITDLSSKVSTQGASISQLQNQIALKVEQTDITTAINKMNIGVRNLVKNSPTLNNSYNQLNTFKGTRTILDDSSAKSGKVVKIECTTAGTGFYCSLWSGDDSCIGKKFTWSFYAKMNTAKTLNKIGHERGGMTSISVTTEWKKFTYTWTYSSSGNRAFVFYPDFVVGNILYIKDFKIEEGDKATDWTPAPEDVDSSIANVQTQVTTTSNKIATIETNLSSITQRVSSTESTVSTHTSQLSTVDSRINTAKNSAISTAASDATSKANNALTNAKSYTDGQITTVNQTITNKVAEIKTTTDSIAQRVSSTESKVTTINGNITNLTSRVSTAESKLTATSLTTTISSAISGGTSSISTTQFVMDKNGLTIKNGALTIKNKAGTTVLNSDTNGNLIFNGTAKSQSGARWVGLDSGGVTFQDSQKNEQMLRVAISYFDANRDMNGVNFALAKYGDFIRFSHIAKADLTNGWTSSDTQYNFFDCWSSDQTVGGVKYKKGLNIYAPAYINNGLFFNNTSGVTSDILGNFTWNNGTGNTTGLLGMCGDNGLFLGYKSGDTYKARLILTEGAHPGTGDNIASWGNWNLNGATVHNGTFAGKFVNTYANEVTRTAAQTFGIEAEETQVRVVFEDVQITNGKAILNIPNKYNGICTGYTIASIVKKGKGDVWVSEEQENRFIIESDNDIKVNIELIVKL